MKNFIPQLNPELELKDIILKLKQFDEEFLKEACKNPTQFKQTIEIITKSLEGVFENIQKDNKNS
nr:hypothetical protein [uncultured Draconibacterium sp.]